MSIISCLSSIAQLILLLLPVPRSIIMCLFLKPQVVIIQGEQVFVRPEEEHDGAGVVELVHLVEVGHLRDVDEVDHNKVLTLLSN